MKTRVEALGEKMDQQDIEIKECSLLSIPEAASILRCSPRTILNRIHSEELNASSVGRNWLVSLASIKDFLRKRSLTNNFKVSFQDTIKVQSKPKKPRKPRKAKKGSGKKQSKGNPSPARPRTQSYIRKAVKS